MSLVTPHDIPLLITVPSDDPSPSAKPLISAERRITPTWHISQLKSKLEPVTGIPAACQTLRTKALDGSWIAISDSENEDPLVGDPRFGLTKGSEIEVFDVRGKGATLNLADVSSVEKYIMPENQYEQLNDSVLAWKRRQGLGRFDPNAKSLDVLVVERREKDSAELEKRGVKVGLRCRVNQSDERRGLVKFVGEVDGLGGDREKGCLWVGVEFDEPVGKNDGSVQVEVAEGEDGKKRTKELRKVFETRGKNYGGLVRPEVLEVGEEWAVVDDLMGSDMEEI